MINKYKTKIIIDGRSITPQTSGIGRYTEELIKGYIMHWGFENVSVILNQEAYNKPYRVIFTKLNRHKILDIFKFHFFLKTLDFDIYHASDLIGPFKRIEGKYYITTVHDLMFKVVPGFYNQKRLKSRLWIIRNTILFYFILRSSNWIISVSETTRRDLKKILRFDSTVYREGINEFKKKTIIEPIKGLEKDSFFLYVGLTSPHKNLSFLISSFLLSNTEKKLIICGKNDNNLSEDNNKVIFTGWVSDEKLTYLYENCSAFIFPSLYEGFGLPILEALSYGKKVFSSNAGSLSEFSDSIVWFFDPKIKSTLIQLIENVDSMNIDKQNIDVYLSHFNWPEIWNEFHQDLKKRHTFIHNY